VPLYSFNFEGRPRPGHPDHGRIFSRDLTIWIPKTTQDAAASEARRLVEKLGFDIGSDVQAKEWDVTSDKSRASTFLQKIITTIQRDGHAVEVGPEFPPL
jgi:hypothetical protein